MKTKKFTSLLISFVMILGLSVTSYAQIEDAITAYINVTQYGEIVKDKNGNELVLAPLELSGKESYTLDNAFETLHTDYYDGSNGYASQTGEYGLYITKFWGDESGNFGYQVNGGEEFVTGLAHEIKNGDIIDAVIYKNTYPDTESYAKFDKYKTDAYVGKPLELTLKRAGYDESWNMVFSDCEGAAVTVDGTDTDYITDENGKVILTFDTLGTYTVSAKKFKTAENVPDITAPICVVTVKDIPDTSITVPTDATLFVGAKEKSKHFVDFIEIEPKYSEADGENTKYYFELDGVATDGNLYNYRISGENYVTYGGTFKKGDTLSVNTEQLTPEGKTKTTIDRDVTSNNGWNVADIYLNINPQGYLKLKTNDTFQIVSLRNWEAVNNTSKNYFIEPDYHYDVIDENGNASEIVTIDENGLLTAKSSGTAIVLVTYDAMTLNFGSGDSFYGAIYPENTGVFAVSVDEDGIDADVGITINEGKNTTDAKLSGDNIDSEHDCIYYMGDKGELEFTPTIPNAKVYAANPSVDTKISYTGFAEVAKNADGSFSVPLTTGRNIVKIEADGKTEYQIVTAKKVTVTVNNGETVRPGDTLSIVFDRLYHPANKLAGVYNMAAQTLYTSVSGYDGEVVGAKSATFKFTSDAAAQTVSNILEEKESWGNVTYEKKADLTVPSDYAYDTFTLSDGCLYISGWGDPYGNHRGITYETGKAPNLNADAKLGYLAKLPDIEIPVVATDSAIESIEFENAKTSYFNGDKFDTESLVVTAKYEDGTTQTALNYTVYPEILTADTEKVTITYRGISEDIPVTVTNPKLTALEITTPPSKTEYKVGDTFSPSGMVVSEVYENGAKKETVNYTYSPNRELEASDKEIIISYTGENAENIADVAQPITVAEETGGTSSSTDKISVYFTLLGDSKHGSGEKHTKKSGNLETWIAKTKITLKKGDTVINLIEKALSINGIPYTNEGNYISKIKGLSEFDNGDLSGWMYTLNGKYPNKGVDEQKLSNGDAVILHYTDDYTVEQPEYSSGSSGGGSSSGGSGTKKDTTVKTDNEKTENTLTTNETAFKEDTYADVKKTDWYYDAVKYAYENNLMNGTDKGFEPESNMTRAMLVTVLWRAEGKPTVDYAISFKDVEDGEWYTEAVRWAASEKIISGVSEEVFGTNDNITREQIVTILYRYMVKKQPDTTADGNIDKFTDAEDVAEYAVSAMKWAVANGIVSGKTENTLCPGDFATRAEVATMLMRFFKVS